MAASVGGAAAALTLCKRYNGRDSGRKEGRGDGKGASDADGVTPPHATRNNWDSSAGLENGILMNEV